MMDSQTAYFLKRFYRNIIKWWFVDYNPNVKRIWPSKAEEEAALLKEAEKEKQHLLESKETADQKHYNATTGSYSGLYGQGMMDDDSQARLDEIMYISSSQTSIDAMVKNAYTDVPHPPEQETIIQEANIIYERLLQEAKEDEARKAAEIEAAKQAYASQRF